MLYTLDIEYFEIARLVKSEIASCNRERSTNRSLSFCDTLHGGWPVGMITYINSRNYILETILISMP